MFLFLMSALALVGTGATIGIVDYFAGDLPSIDAIQTANLSQTTRILDRNGNLIEALYHENRTVVPLNKISVKLQRATIATEDRTFYDNSGVDYRRLAIAIVYDLTHHSATLGGSTITEQVVKNDVLDTAEAQSRTVSRKVRELLLAEEMERRYTKKQILELYLNTINYGNGAYGAEAAAETYFQVHASELSWAQASFLAGLPQAPSDSDPFGSPDQVQSAKERWRQVLNGMVTVGDVSASSANTIYGSDLMAKMIAAHKSLPLAHNPRTAHHHNSRPGHAGDGRQMGEVRRAGLRAARREHGRDAGHESLRRGDPRHDRQRQLQQPRDPRSDQSDGHGPARMARGGLVIQGLHVRRGDPGRAHHTGDARQTPDRRHRRAHVQRLGRKARGIHPAAHRARAVAQPAGTVDVLIGRRRPRGFVPAQPRRDGSDRKPRGRGDDARP